MSQLFTSGDQSIGASASVLPVHIQDRFPLGWTGWISLQSKGLSRVFSKTTVQKHQFFGAQPSLWSSSYIRTWLLEKPWLWLCRPLSAMSLLCNTLSRFVIPFLPRSRKQYCIGFLPNSNMNQPQVYPCPRLEWASVTCNLKNLTHVLRENLKVRVSLMIADLEQLNFFRHFSKRKLLWLQWQVNGIFKSWC